MLNSFPIIISREILLEASQWFQFPLWVFCCFLNDSNETEHVIYSIRLNESNGRQPSIKSLNGKQKSVFEKQLIELIQLHYAEIHTERKKLTEFEFAKNFNLVAVHTYNSINEKIAFWFSHREENVLKSYGYSIVLEVKKHYQDIIIIIMITHENPLNHLNICGTPWFFPFNPLQYSEQRYRQIEM